MHHVLSLNLAKIGYSTFAGDPATGFEAQPLGVANGQVSVTVLNALNRLDDLVRQHPPYRSLRFAYADGGQPEVCYGCFFPRARDALGREGLVFLHGFELADSAVLPRAVLAILQVFSPEALERLEVEVGRLAHDEDTGSSFLNAWCRSMEERINLSTFDGTLRPSAVAGRIVHDIAGGSSVAWWTFAIGQAIRPMGWSVADTVVEGCMITEVNPPCEGIALASTLLLQGLSGALVGTKEQHGSTSDTRSALAGEATVVDLTIVKSLPDATVKVPARESWPPARSESNARNRTLWRARWTLAAGALGAVVGTGITTLVLRRDDPSGVRAASTVAVGLPAPAPRVLPNHRDVGPGAPPGTGPAHTGSAPPQDTAMTVPRGTATLRVAPTAVRSTRTIVRPVRQSDESPPRSHAIEHGSPSERPPTVHSGARAPNPPPVE